MWSKFAVVFPKFVEYLLLYCPVLNPWDVEWLKNAARTIIKQRMDNDQVGVYLQTSS